MTDDPTTTLVTRANAHIAAKSVSLTLFATRTGIGFHRLRRILNGETKTLKLNDARLLEEYLTGEGA